MTADATGRADTTHEAEPVTADGALAAPIGTGDDVPAGPTRANYRDHGQPAEALYFGRGRTPEQTGRRVTLARVGMAVRISDPRSDATIEQPGGSAKLWLAPVPGTPQHEPPAGDAAIDAAIAAVTVRAREIPAELIARAEQLGRRAYADGCPAAPGADPEIRDMVTGWDVGTGAAHLFQAFTRGYSAAADYAAALAVQAAEITAQTATAAEVIAERNPAAAHCAQVAAAGAESAARNAATRTAEAAAARAELARSLPCPAHEGPAAEQPDAGTAGPQAAAR